MVKHEETFRPIDVCCLTAGKKTRSKVYEIFILSPPDRLAPSVARAAIVIVVNPFKILTSHQSKL
jgi:hypothetical protein